MEPTVNSFHLEEIVCVKNVHMEESDLFRVTGTLFLQRDVAVKLFYVIFWENGIPITSVELGWQKKSQPIKLSAWLDSTIGKVCVFL